MQRGGQDYYYHTDDLYNGMANAVDTMAHYEWKIGEDPDELPHTYARLINDTIRDRPDDMIACMHLCRGNHRSSWVAEGGYEPVAEALFNESLDMMRVGRSWVGLNTQRGPLRSQGQGRCSRARHDEVRRTREQRRPQAQDRGSFEVHAAGPAGVEPAMRLREHDAGKRARR